MNTQLHFYFVLRDFVLPGMVAMKSRVSVQVRGVRAAPLPGDLVAQANSLADIIQQRRKFVLEEQQQPFTASTLKEMSVRDLKMVTADEVEQARWKEVFFEALAKSLYGRPNDIEALISCGALKPDARALANRVSDD
jgi:hypothetical protein